MISSPCFNKTDEAPELHLMGYVGYYIKLNSGWIAKIDYNKSNKTGKITELVLNHRIAGYEGVQGYHQLIQ